MGRATFNQQMTDHDLQAWMEDFLIRLELQTMIDHEVHNQDGTVEQVKVRGVGAGA